MNVILILAEVIKRTPVIAWVILAVLIVRGVSASRENVLCFPKSLIFPAVFIVWGLETVVKEFSFPLESILSYTVLAAMGAPVGYALYSRYRSFYQKDGAVWRSGTYLPMVIMMINFIVKYISNVAMSINPGFCSSLGFNLFYSMAGGFSLGLTLGGVVQAYKASASYKMPDSRH